MSSTTIYTWADVLDHLLDMMGAASDARAVRMCKTAILQAYRDLAQAKDGGWTCFLQTTRLTTVATYITGTIAYTQATRALALTDGSWPLWSDLGTICINGISYPVDSRDSNSQLTLSLRTNPGEDITAGTTFTLYQESYTLPVDFGSAGQMIDVEIRSSLTYLSPQEWLSAHYALPSPSRPTCYTIQASPHYQGVSAASFSPPPSSVLSYDFLERRQPRQLRTCKYEDGTVSTSDINGTVSGGAFTSKMVGSVIRFGNDGTTEVTGMTGENPFSEMRIIQTVTSPTAFTIDSALPDDVTGYRYDVTDPIDLEVAAMYTAFLRGAENALAIAARRDDVEETYARYTRALKLALEGDSKSTARRPGRAAGWPRVQDFPVTIT